MAELGYVGSENGLKYLYDIYSILKIDSSNKILGLRHGVGYWQQCVDIMMCIDAKLGGAGGASAPPLFLPSPGIFALNQYIYK